MTIQNRLSKLLGTILVVGWLAAYSKLYSILSGDNIIGIAAVVSFWATVLLIFFFIYIIIRRSLTKELLKISLFPKYNKTQTKKNFLIFLALSLLAITVNAIIWFEFDNLVLGLIIFGGGGYISILGFGLVLEVLYY